MSSSRAASPPVRGFGREFGADDVVGVRVVDGARRRGGEQLVDALPLRELRRAADVVGQVLVPGILPSVEPGVLEGGRDGVDVHALRPSPYDAAADPGQVDRLAGRGDARGEWTAGGAPGRPGRGHRRPQFVVRIRERVAVRALCGSPPDRFIAGA
ncbi:hypothetical protein [Streptomyces albidoflavus]|uniref:hypothetical protein n=1 Tax=Streptomyces albidoflavus TaxID=1886 RepID=UPI003324FCD7